jgi:hypothetical protein
MAEDLGRQDVPREVTDRPLAGLRPDIGDDRGENHRRPKQQKFDAILTRQVAADEFLKAVDCFTHD